MAEELPGRADLIQWVESHPQNYYEVSSNLTAVLDLRAGVDRRVEMEPRLRDFGGVVAAVIEPAVVTTERRRETPALVAYDSVGRRVDRIEFHPDQQVATAAAWDSGLLSCDSRPGGAFEQAALFYLLSHVGEGGIACPAVCTVGLGRALAHRGSKELQSRYLDQVRANGLAGSLRGSQFLTEVQGGSDVGANLAAATLDGDEPGAWRISGEKWFCSVADADLFVVTARPLDAAGGTKGLGCFLVPRSLDGATPNGFRIRQLKDKLGTRGLASAEIDFEGALGWPIGGVDEGFSVAVEELLNTSRWLNAVGSTGLMRRAYLEAVSFARHRRAFGRTIGSIPIVREQLALMKVEEYAALSSTMALTGLIDRMDHALASKRDVAVHRFLVNVNKFQTSLSATAAVHQGIEILGGNGTIETFSALPRLYRDSVVYESWEGTHNVLCAQVQRDCERLGLLDDVADWIEEELRPVDHEQVSAVRFALAALLPRFRSAVEAGESGAGELRRLIDRFAQVIQAATLLREAKTGVGEKSAVAELFVTTHLLEGPTNSVKRSLVDAVLASDL
jgi:acyl-CoA dehydrogenase